MFFIILVYKYQGWALRSFPFGTVRSVLFRSLKGAFCSFPFFFRVFGDL